MAAFTALEMLSMEAPELAGASITKNGITKTLKAFFQALLDSNDNSTELALAQLFRILSMEDRNESLTLGEFSFTRRTGMSFDERRQYWEQQYRARLMGQSDCVPTVGDQYYIPYPDVR